MKKQASKQAKKIKYNGDLVKDFARRRPLRNALNPVACMLMRDTELRRSRGDKEMKMKEDIQFR